MKKRNEIWYDVLAVVIVGIWGMTFISTAKLLEFFQPAQIFVIRFSIAYLGMWFFAHDRFFAENLKDELIMMLGGITGGSIYFLTENTALQVSGQTSSISFIVCTTPLVTALLALALRQDGARLNWKLALGSIVALTGVGLVILGGKTLLGAPVSGYLLAMGASLSWAFYTIIVNNLGKRYNSAMITRKVFFYGLVTIVPVLLIQNRSFDWSAFKNPAVDLNILFLAVVASLGCYALWTPVIKKLGAIKASNYIYLNPVFTLLGSLVFLHEQMTWIALIGSALTLLGVWLACSRSSVSA